MKNCFLSSLVFGVLLSGCELVGSSNPKTLVNVTTSQEAYQLTDTTQITLNIENLSSSSIFYSTCDRKRIEELEEGRLLNTATVVHACRCICTFEVKAGEQEKLYLSPHWITSKDKLRLREGLTYRIFPLFYAGAK